MSGHESRARMVDEYLLNFGPKMLSQRQRSNPPMAVVSGGSLPASTLRRAVRRAGVVASAAVVGSR